MRFTFPRFWKAPRKILLGVHFVCTMIGLMGAIKEYKWKKIFQRRVSSTQEMNEIAKKERVQESAGS